MLNTFDAPTRAAAQTNLLEFGDALAGRGPALNAAIGRLPRRARTAAAGGQEPLLAPDRARAVHHRARGDRRRARAGGRDPGRGVRLPRHHLHRARRGRAAVHPGVDLRGPADRGRRDRHPAADSHPARHLDLALQRPRAGGDGAADGLAGDRLGARDRDADRRPLRSAQRPARADLRIALRAQQRHRRQGRDQRRDRRRRTRSGRRSSSSRRRRPFATTPLSP